MWWSENTYNATAMLPTHVFNACGGVSRASVNLFLAIVIQTVGTSGTVSWCTSVGGERTGEGKIDFITSWCIKFEFICLRRLFLAFHCFWYLQFKKKHWVLSVWSI